MTIFAGTIFDKHEELARTMFENAGFSLDDSSQRMSVHMPYDFVASKEKRQYFVEVKTSLSLNYRNIAGILSWMQKLSLVAEKANAIPVLFCFALMSASERDNLKKQCKNLIVFDLANILYYLKETELYNEVVSSLSFNVETIQHTEGELDLSSNKSSLKTSAKNKYDFKHRLESCKAGDDGAKEFERICTDILVELFGNKLDLWHSQKKSNDKAFFFDLVCRIKDDNEGTFWRILENYFRSKYVVFEFKNYVKKITQKEVYSTERYLYAKALRNVAIIIARNGYDNHAEWVAKGSLRENGKLILLITANDLIHMYENRKDIEDPSAFLLSKLDTLLEELEK